MFDDEAPKKKTAHEIGASLDALSVDELEERVGLLEQEIVRLKEAIAARRVTKSAADSVFKF